MSAPDTADVLAGLHATTTKDDATRLAEQLRRAGLVDITGLRFGRLVVLDIAPTSTRSGQARWSCRCDCGAERIANGSSLRRGAVTSCGCLRREKAARERKDVVGYTGAHERCIRSRGRAQLLECIDCGEPQPDYPYRFTQAEVMQMLADGLPPAHARHFSFPCQIHTDARHLRKAQGGESKYVDLLTPGLEIIRDRYNDTPWIIENVDDRTGHVRKIMAPREGETLIVLCGSMFGLQVQRHRLFLANFPLRRPAPVPGKGKYRAQGCDHSTFPIDPRSGNPRPWGVWHVKGDNIPAGGHTARDEEHGRQVMGSHRSLPWDKLKEGFPPAYTAWIAADLLVELRQREASDTLEVVA